MRIQVTQDDIDKGIPKDCNACPVARAVRRALNADAVSAAARIRVQKGSKRIHYKPSLRVFKFYRQFDGGYFVKPFTFELGRATNRS